jgi:ABC-type branched-subunit amino acid transport system substrate-binding protein
MESNRILLLRSEGDDASPIDQSLGARLSAVEGPAHSTIIIEEEVFCRDDLADIERKLAPWKGKVSGVIGTTNVPESTRLGELSEELKLLCFVANNNPSVWQRRKHVFHIGLPSAQTAEAVATLLQKTQRKRIFLLHDQTEFQRRVASSMEAALRNHDLEVSSRAGLTDADFESMKEWDPDLIYVIFSSESKSLPLVEKIRYRLGHVALLFGRSLLRESFLSALDDKVSEAWFVDMFHRNRTQTTAQQHFLRVLSARGNHVPTANHAFGWDAISFCALGLQAGRGKSVLAIDYLESGVALEGATGTCSFSRDNHNGRSGFGPTTLTRWYRGHLEEVV